MADIISGKLARKFTVRPLEPSDNPALKAFVENVPDGGRIAVQLRYKFRDLLQATEITRPGSQAFGVFMGQLIGLVNAWPHRMIIGGEERQAVLLNSLSVHPDYRLQGVASELLSNAINWSKETLASENLVIYGFIQKGNRGSIAACTKVGGRLAGKELTVYPARTRAVAKKPLIGLTVREATGNDLASIVAGLNNFYSGYDLYIPQSAETLAIWLSPKTIEGEILNLSSYYIGLDKRGEIQAGVGVFNGPTLVDLQVVKLPMAVKILNKMLKLLPPDGMMGAMPVSRVWYNPGQLELAQNLWDWVCVEGHSKGRRLLATFDEASPLKDFYRPSPLRPTSRVQPVIFSGPLLPHGSDYLAG